MSTPETPYRRGLHSSCYFARQANAIVRLAAIVARLSESEDREDSGAARPWFHPNFEMNLTNTEQRS